MEAINPTSPAIKGAGALSSPSPIFPFEQTNQQQPSPTDAHYASILSFKHSNQQQFSTYRPSLRTMTLPGSLPLMWARSRQMAPNVPLSTWHITSPTLSGEAMEPEILCRGAKPRYGDPEVARGPLNLAFAPRRRSPFFSSLSFLGLT